MRQRAPAMGLTAACLLGCAVVPRPVADDPTATAAAAPVLSSGVPAPVEPPVPECGPQGTGDACQRACEAGLAKSCLRFGHLRVGNVPGWDRYDPVEAGAAFQKACDQGLAEACDALGVLYQGNALERDYPKAMALFRKACDLGDETGCGHHAALRLGSEPGVEAETEADVAEAVAMADRACTRAHDDACLALAISYYYGRPLKKDPVKGRMLAEKACERGHREACELAATAWEALRGHGSMDAFNYRQKGGEWATRSCESLQRDCGVLAWYLYDGYVVMRDPGALERWAGRGCGEVKRPEACEALGTAYATGQGVRKDEARAISFHETACRGGDAEACFQLSGAYKDGEGVAPDAAKAFAFKVESCRLGLAMGCDIAGTYLHNAYGVQRDDAKALFFRRRACAWRGKYACAMLGGWLVTHDGKEVPAGEGVKESVTHWRRGCETPDYLSCFDLAQAYSRGWGVAKDHAKARELARAGCSGGEKRACAWLANPRKVPKWVQERDAEDAKATKEGNQP